MKEISVTWDSPEYEIGEKLAGEMWVADCLRGYIVYGLESEMIWVFVSNEPIDPQECIHAAINDVSANEFVRDSDGTIQLPGLFTKWFVVPQIREGNLDTYSDRIDKLHRWLGE